MLALSTALSRPWADVVLTGAASVGQIQSDLDAVDLAKGDDLDEHLRSAFVDSAEYWRARSSFKWN